MQCHRLHDVTVTAMYSALFKLPRVLRTSEPAALDLVGLAKEAGFVGLTAPSRPEAQAGELPCSCLPEYGIATAVRLSA